MKEKAITEVVEDRFKTIDKLCPKIIKDFDADDIHDLRIEVKKLRAFLRLMDIQKEIEEALIPKLLKTFYGDVGIIRNIQLHKHRLFKYITNYRVGRPEEYIKVMDAEEIYWEEQATELMEHDSFHDAEEKILKELPDKLDNSSVKKFAENKLNELKEQLKEMNDETSLHNVRKILKDILYTWDYIKDQAKLPKAICGEEKLKSLTKMLGDFIDKCIQLEFLEPGYVDKINDESEKDLLLEIKNDWQKEKELIMQELHYSLDDLNKQL